MRESYIHVSIRQYLKQNDWNLVAGEFPGGTDDELYVLNIMNPELAKDNSPDHRRHSKGEIIPDLIAYKNNYALIIEAKPKYSISDELKLMDLLNNKKDLLVKSLDKFCRERNVLPFVNWHSVKFIPTLAFEKPEILVDAKPGFAYILVKDINNVELVFKEI